jgi:hypothetical protein
MRRKSCSGKDLGPSGGVAERRMQFEPEISPATIFSKSHFRVVKLKSGGFLRGKVRANSVNTLK